MASPTPYFASVTKAVLEPLGLPRRGRSSRHWIADRGWWLLNVEFQPSGWAKSVAYLNVGEQHLWVQRDYFVFEECESPLGGAFNADLTDTAQVDTLVATAAAATPSSSQPRMNS